MTDRIRRITEMEQHMKQAEAAIKALETAVDSFEEAEDSFLALQYYYESPQWRMDLEADEAGLLPQDLHRGVLSEDGIYNLLEEYEALKNRLRAFS